MSIEFDDRTRRPYRQTRRADAVRSTRERIAAAAAELHEERGVSRTTVSEIARRADVTRLTVYQHFPDLRALLPACAEHYESRHPMPDLHHLGPRSSGEERRRGIEDLYGWYREVAPLFGKVMGERAGSPELDEFLRAGIDHVLDDLARRLVASDGEVASARLAVDFWTWKQLETQGLDDAAAATLVTSRLLS